jgi:hypothetical protein
MNGDTYREMLALLRRLDEAKDDEVHIEVERFRSSGKIYDESVLEE